VDLHPHGGGAENMYLIIIGYLDGKLGVHHLNLRHDWCEMAARVLGCNR